MGLLLLTYNVRRRFALKHFFHKIRFEVRQDRGPARRHTGRSEQLFFQAVKR